MIKTSPRVAERTSRTAARPATTSNVALPSENGAELPTAVAPAGTPFVCLLLFLSGACALIYQVAWLREFHLVFGGSTAASGAVLSIFMAGLGLGNLLLGRRADRFANPLKVYGVLELGIAFSVAVSPWLIDGIRLAYAATGGQTTLGLATATLLRLCLACLVMLAPTMLMGGTLPAAVRAATDPRDTFRRSLAFLYGCNTLGAVVGSALSTFIFLELWGTRTTLWIACAVNVVLGVVSIVVSRRKLVAPNSAQQPQPARQTRKTVEHRTAAPRFIYLAAAVVGFAFFLMELVWYRMLAPLLGGTTFALGIILAVALAGIGLGGLLWGPVSKRVRPTIGRFAWTCALEALLIAAPFALGDRIAIHAAESRLLHANSFFSLAMSWAGIAALVVLPAAIVSGLQFPLLVSLLGRGRDGIGREVGQAFAFNTIGAIVGSLAGGFGLLPLLSANGAWAASVLLLCALGSAAAIIEFRQMKQRMSFACVLAMVAASVACLTAVGPTAAWRHGGIGAGRYAAPGKGANKQLEWLSDIRRRFIYEADGIEASVAIESTNGYAFYVNGKSDGNAIGDAGTQIMLGVLPAWLHAEAKTGLVVGLGTGETAGWLAEAPGIERVDVVELEPAIDRMASLCAPLNFDVLNHPKVRRLYNDAREVLVTTSTTYDLIVSEPSNPYRVGIANLFTREFYQSVDRRLNEGGLFVQWLQSYEVDEETVRTVFATVNSVFDHVEVWQCKPEDMLLVCSRGPIPCSEQVLRERLKVHPFQEAAVNAWRVKSLEGMLSRYIAGTDAAKRFAGPDARINTDDRNIIEYGFALSLGRQNDSHSLKLHEMAIEIGDGRPPLQNVRWHEVDDHRQVFLTIFRGTPVLPSHPTEAQRERFTLLDFYCRAEMPKVVELWRSSGRQPTFPGELTLVAIACAETGDSETLSLLNQVEQFNRTEAEAIRALYYLRKGEFEKSTISIEATLAGMRTDPWAFSHAMELVFPVALNLGAKQPAFAGRIWRALEQPFAASAYDQQRRVSRLQLSAATGSDAVLESISSFEPHPIWDETFLEARAKTYRVAEHPLKKKAETDLSLFKRNKTVSK